MRLLRVRRHMFPETLVMTLVTNDDYVLFLDAF